ncbi:cytochrome p450 [Moniliophthora roreri MCA 2997]|uniref:Cytochrome p450 n=1 Tax=Moniliophthora roreri (strain MCA 2997) TaxID=1381753 RepID=V2X4L3_MONRO|nr:cytochrome p450 [Moniliophthora roreri MCA 2997]
MILRDSLIIVGAAGVAAYLVFKRTETLKNTNLVLLLVAIPSLLSTYLSISTVPIWNVLLVFIGYLFTILSCIVVYRVSPWHPLAAYPGPLLLSGTRGLHEQYGDVVRIGPNELSFLSPDALGPIMGQHGLPKGQFWDGRFPENQKVRPVTALQDLEQHRQRRGPWNKAFSSAALKEYEVLVSKRTALLGDKLAAESESGKPVEFGQWIGWYTYDLMTDFVFSGGSEMLRQGDVEGLIADIRSGLPNALFMSHVPWLGRLLYRIPKGFYSAQLKFRQNSFARAMKRKEMGGEKKDLYYYLLDEANDKKVHSGPEVIADASAAVLGGSDTTSNTVTLIVFYLLTRPNALQRIKEEVDSVGDQWNDVSVQTKMPYLNGIINETLRMWPAVLDGSQRRIQSDSQGRMVGESYVPPGTNVTIPFYSLQRDPRHFSPIPDEWISERWLDEAQRIQLEPKLFSGAGYKHDMKCFVAFSAGPANCVGKGLAMMEMRAAICMLLKRFDMRLRDHEKVKGSFERGIQDLWTMRTEDLWVEFSERRLLKSVA